MQEGTRQKALEKANKIVARLAYDDYLMDNITRLNKNHESVSTVCCLIHFLLHTYFRDKINIDCQFFPTVINIDCPFFPHSSLLRMITWWISYADANSPRKLRENCTWMETNEPTGSPVRPSSTHSTRRTTTPSVNWFFLLSLHFSKRKSFLQHVFLWLCSVSCRNLASTLPGQRLPALLEFCRHRNCYWPRNYAWLRWPGLVWHFNSVGPIKRLNFLDIFKIKGAQTDGDGKLINWWDDESLKNFKERAKGIIDQYSSYNYLGVQLKGVNNQGENIADNGGLKESYAVRKFPSTSLIHVSSQVQIVLLYRDINYTVKRD